MRGAPLALALALAFALAFALALALPLAAQAVPLPWIGDVPLPPPPTVSAYLAAGSGNATVYASDGATPCPSMQAQLSWHAPLIGETNLIGDFAASTETGNLLCPTGVRPDFNPGEIRGDPWHGLRAFHDTQDAVIWLNLTAPNAKGAQTLDMLYIEGYGGSALRFHGTVAQP